MLKPSVSAEARPNYGLAEQSPHDLPMTMEIGKDEKLHPAAWNETTFKAWRIFVVT